MDEERRVDSGEEAPASEENGNILTRDIPEQQRSASAKRVKSSGSADTKPKSEAKSSGKSRSKSAKSGKTTAAEPEKKSKSKSKPAEETPVKTRKKKSVSESLASELIDDKPLVKKRAVKMPDKPDQQLPEVEPVSEQEAQQAADDGGARASCKTPQVMKLIEDDDDELVIYAGKSRVPKLLRGRESLSRLSRRAAGNETEVVNITELVIRREAPEILDRFNACSCDRCVEVFSEIIAQRIPVRYARISRSELELRSLPERAVPMRKIVLPEMIRELICNKKRSFHDE